MSHTEVVIFDNVHPKPDFDRALVNVILRRAGIGIPSERAPHQ
jgi:hypothetical protein